MGDGKPWTLTEHSRVVHGIDWDIPKGTRINEWEGWAFLSSDHHWDSTKCDRDLLRKHLELARDRGAPCIFVGDTYDAMGGRYDPRSSGKGDIRPELLERGNYFDELVSQSAEWYAPYRDVICVVGLGNHETNVLRRQETDLVERFCERLRMAGGIARPGGYGGWLRICFRRNSRMRSITIKYFHGSGGGAPVSKGLIDFHRRGEWLSGVDVIVEGHKHWATHHMTPRLKLNKAFQVERRQCHSIRCGAYKDDYGDGHSGFLVERGATGPRPLGGWWLRFTLNDAHEVTITPIKAV